MMPSMSFGVSPASARAASDARIWSATTLWPELRLYAVSPTPEMAPLSRSDMSPSVRSSRPAASGRERSRLLPAWPGADRLTHDSDDGLGLQVIQITRGQAQPLGIDLGIVLAEQR